MDDQDDHCFKLTPEDHEALGKIAMELGFSRKVKDVSQPDFTAFLTALANGEIGAERVANDPELENVRKRAGHVKAQPGWIRKHLGLPPLPRPKRKEKQLPHVPERWSPRCGYTHARWLRLRRKIDGSA